jgi:hypothetical protein
LFALDYKKAGYKKLELLFWETGSLLLIKGREMLNKRNKNEQR